LAAALQHHVRSRATRISSQMTGFTRDQDAA